MSWGLPPETAWPQFLRLLRRPGPPRGWLDAAADIPEIQRRPMLLRWIAQHRSAPAHLRARLMARLPWRALAAISEDPSAHPQARALSVERLLSLWPGMTTGERRSFAHTASRRMWPLVWKVRDVGVIRALLQHPKMSLEMAVNLVQPPIQAPHIDALLQSPLSGAVPMIKQVLTVMDKSLLAPGHGLALGAAAPWIKKLGAEDLRQLSAEIEHTAIRGMMEKVIGVGG